MERAPINNPSPESNAEGFETRMQRLYVGPIYGAIQEMKSIVPDKPEYEILKKEIDQACYNYDELPESEMDEEDLKKDLANVEEVLSNLKSETLSEEEKVALIKEKIVTWM